MSAVNLTLPDGNQLQIDAGQPYGEAVRSIGEGLFRNAVAVTVDGVHHPLDEPATEGGQMLVIFIIAVAACEAAIALALILMLYQRRGSLDVALWQDLREDNLPPYVDRELPEPPDEEQPDWPKLPQAGRDADLPREQTDYRSHV